MTYQEYTQLLSQLPEDLRKEYGFNEPFDYSQYKCIHTNEYDYYPELNCCIIDEIPIIWESGNPWVTPENPEILKGFQKFKRHNDKIKHMKIVELSPNKRINCYSPVQMEPHNTNFKRKGYTSFVTIHNEKIYYNPNNIDLQNKPETIKLAKCLFWAYKHNPIGLAPNKNEPVEDWTVIEFIGDKRFYVTPTYW